MNYHIVSILDTAVGAFGRPVFTRSKGEALRIFIDEVNRPNTDQQPNAMNAHPEDYRLFYLGSFDDNTGHFTTPEIPEHLMDAREALVNK